MTQESEPTDADIERLQHEKDTLAEQVQQAETELETPTAERPVSLSFDKASIVGLKLECLLDFFMPTEGPGANNNSKRERLLFEVFFLSRYQAAIANAKIAADAQFEELKSRQLREKLAVNPVQAAAFGNIFKPGG